MAVESQPAPALAGKWPAEPMTYEQFLAAGEYTHAEWVNGKVIFMSPVSSAHAELNLFLASVIVNYVRERNLGKVYQDPFQMKTGPKLPGRAPDILYVSNENLSRVKRAYLDGPADLVIEIVSPESRAVDRGEKFCEYEEGGVREYWLIDQPRKKAEFFKLSAEGHYQPIEVKANGRFESGVLPGFWLNAGWLWEEPLAGYSEILERWRHAHESNPFRSGRS